MIIDQKLKSQIDNMLMNYEKKEIPHLTIDRKVGFIDDKYILSVFSDETFYESVLQYIHKKYPDKIKEFSYEEKTPILSKAVDYLLITYSSNLFLNINVFSNCNCLSKSGNDFM